MASHAMPPRWESFYGPNAGYLMDLYEQYLNDPKALDPVTRAVFEEMGAPPLGAIPQNETPALGRLDDSSRLDLISQATDFLRNIRAYGHLSAKIHPLDAPPQLVPLLRPETYHLSATELQSIPARLVWTEAPPEVHTAWDAITWLTRLYTGTTAYEFRQVQDLEERNWLDQYVDNGSARAQLSSSEQRTLLLRLISVEQFERFLHTTFPGQKRFSIEGTDTLVPMLDTLTHLSAEAHILEVTIGMAHRGRLNVLAHNLGKPYKDIFSEFHTAPNKDLVPSEGSSGINFGWTGDVKYHLGAKKTVQDSSMVSVKLTLANNPSHLEFVNPACDVERVFTSQQNPFEFRIDGEFLGPG